MSGCKKFMNFVVVGVVVVFIFVYMILMIQYIVVVDVCVEQGGWYDYDIEVCLIEQIMLVFGWLLYSLC